MKKNLLIAVVGLLVLTFAAALASAAPANLPPFTRNQVNLTDTQKEELAPLFNQMTDLRKQMFEVRKQVIQKQVEFGNLTQEQADQRIARMQERLENNSGPGMMGRGPGMKRGGPGFCPNWQQQPQSK